MNNRNNEEEEAYRPPEWLTQALGTAAPSILGTQDGAGFYRTDPAFEARCRQAAEAALSIAMLRAERQRVGFVPMPFSDYVNGLVKLANVPLSPIMSWLGVETFSGLDLKVVNAYARLAQAIGLSLREVAMLMRISFAAQVGSVPVSLLVARRRSTAPQRTSLETSEAALREIEANYDSDKLVELHQIESELSAAYAATDGSGNRPS